MTRIRYTVRIFRVILKEYEADLRIDDYFSYNMQQLQQLTRTSHKFPKIDIIPEFSEHETGNLNFYLRMCGQRQQFGYK